MIIAIGGFKFCNYRFANLEQTRIGFRDNFKS